ncbi:MAG: VWA domain-containing protein [Roseburia sp.]|nr:VWA domain-containing protein [Roseburia sp.]
MRRKRFLIQCLAAVLTFLSAATAPCAAYAKDAAGTGKAVVFLLDVSGSMKTNDPNRYAMDGMAQFIYTLPSDYEVGFVAYNAEVCAEITPVDNAHRSEITEAADTVPYAGYSNAGAGMERAVRLLSDSAAAQRDIVLLSDGECLMGDEDATALSYAAYCQAVAQAAENGIRIHVIGLGAEMEDTENSVFQAAAATGGGRYHSPQALEIQSGLDSILQERLHVRQMTAALVDAGEAPVSLELSLPFAHADTVRVLLTSDSPIRNLTTNFNADGAVQVNGERYSLIEADSPKSGRMDVSFSGTPGHQIRIILIPEYRVLPKVSIEYEDRIPEAEDASVYEREAVITYTFYDMENDTVRLWTEDWFAHGRLSVSSEGELRAGALEEGQLIFREPVTEACVREVSFDCSELPVNVLDIGTVTVRLEGPPPLPAEEPERFPAALYGIAALAAAVMILIAIAAVRAGKRRTPVVIPDNDGRPEPGKSSYMGRLNIYITRTASGYDISPLSYDLFRLPSGRVVSMAEILAGCGVRETFAGADRIYISSGQGHSIILTNQSDCCIMKSGEILMKKKSCQLFAGAKVDVAFEDEIGELTFQYRELKPSEMY